MAARLLNSEISLIHLVNLTQKAFVIDLKIPLPEVQGATVSLAAANETVATVLSELKKNVT